MKRIKREAKAKTKKKHGSSDLMDNKTTDPKDDESVSDSVSEYTHPPEDDIALEKSDDIAIDSDDDGGDKDEAADVDAEADDGGSASDAGSDDLDTDEYNNINIRDEFDYDLFGKKNELKKKEDIVLEPYMEF